jgi:hypothetical protein
MSAFPAFQPTNPALKVAAMLALGGLYVAGELAAWFALVPDVLSVGTFAWTSAMAFITVIAASASIARARPTRSIAHVLYDVEHPASLRKA